MQKSSAVVLIICLHIFTYAQPAISGSAICKYENNRYAYCDDKLKSGVVIMQYVAYEDRTTDASPAYKQVNQVTNNKEEQKKQNSAALELLRSEVLKKKRELEISEIEFSEDAKSPEVIKNGFRNFPRFLAKMRARETRVTLAERDYYRAVEMLNNEYDKLGLPPLPKTRPPVHDSAKWAFDYWKDIQKEMSANWGANEVDKIVSSYLFDVRNEVRK